MERRSWLTHPGRRGGEERRGGAGPGDAGGALDGCRVRMGTRVHGWKQLRHVTSDFIYYLFFLKGNTTEFVDVDALGLHRITV